MLKLVALLLAMAMFVSAEADAKAEAKAVADADAEADPAILVTEHRRAHSVQPGYVVKGSKHLPGYGYKEFKAYKPPVALSTYDTRRTLYPDVIPPVVRYVHHSGPSYGYLPHVPISPDYYGGQYGGSYGYEHGSYEHGRNFIDDHDDYY